MMVIKTRL